MTPPCTAYMYIVHVARVHICGCHVCVCYILVAHFKVHRDRHNMYRWMDGPSPLRWICTSGLKEDLDTTDQLALTVLQDIAGKGGVSLLFGIP